MAKCKEYCSDGGHHDFRKINYEDYKCAKCGCLPKRSDDEMAPIRQIVLGGRRSSKKTRCNRRRSSRKNNRRRSSRKN